MMADRRPHGIVFWIVVAAVLAGLMAAGRASAQGGDSAPTPAATAGPARAAVVVQAQGKADTYCVELPESGATGLDALRATGRELNVMAGPLGAAVCRLESLGCSYPAEHCFCQCQGSTCRYWAYFFQNESGNWQYSGMGMAGRPLQDGAVEGWLWTDGSNRTPTGNLPVVTFDSICGASSQASATAHTTAEAAPGAGTSSLDSAGVIVFAVLVVGVGGLLWWRRSGRRSGSGSAQ